MNAKISSKKNKKVANVKLQSKGGVVDLNKNFSQKSSASLEAAKRIINIIREDIDNAQNGNETFSSELIEKELRENKNILKDPALKKEILNNLEKLIIAFTNTCSDSQATCVIKFMKHNFMLGNAYFKKDPFQTTFYNTAREAIKVSLLGDASAQGVFSVLAIFDEMLFSKEKIFPIPEIKTEYKNYGLEALRISLSYGCTEQAVNIISFMEQYLEFDKNSLKGFFTRRKFRKILFDGLNESLNHGMQYADEDLYAFGTEYLGLNKDKLNDDLYNARNKYLMKKSQESSKML